MSFVAHFRALIADNFGILALFQVLIADSFGILAFLQLLIAENFVILALYPDQVPNTPPYPVVSSSLNFANFFRQLLIVPITATTLLIFLAIPISTVLHTEIVLTPLTMSKCCSLMVCFK